MTFHLTAPSHYRNQYLDKLNPIYCIPPIYFTDFVMEFKHFIHELYSNCRSKNGTRSARISLTRAVPWNSMELGMRQFRWHEHFHGIRWNSIEFGVRQFRWHGKFHGIWDAPISMTRAVPWNSMELEVRQLRWHEQFHGIHISKYCFWYLIDDEMLFG